MLPQLDLLTFSFSDKFDESDSSSKLVIIKLALMYIYKPPFSREHSNPSPLASKYQGKARKQHAFKGVLFTAYYIEYLIEPVHIMYYAVLIQNVHRNISQKMKL